MSWRILLVDDNTQGLSLMYRILKRVGFQDVTMLSEPYEAIIQATLNPPDLIVVDYNLPGLSGLELVRRLRKDNHSMRILVVSGQMDEMAPFQVLENGADRFLPKPFENKEFLKCVEDLLAAPAIRVPA